MMKSGTVYKFGDVVLVEVPFTDSAQMKLRPALVLFEELDNVIVAGITSNQSILYLMRKGKPSERKLEKKWVYSQIIS